MAPLATASDVFGTALDADVSLSWTYPVSIVAQNIVFDVYGSLDPLDLLGHQLASGVAALSVALTAVPLAGTVYFTVIARRGDLISLPTKPFALLVQPPVVLQTVSQVGPLATPPPSGLGFPFQITGLGSVYAQGGDDLLRGKILQLLLTAPGERVNLPDYGTRLIDLVFDPNSDVLAATTEFMVARTLQKYLGDEIRVDGVTVTNNDNELDVDIVYLKKSDLRIQQVRIGVPLP